ncbi:hypothetical protein CJP74_03670 [Psittacicella melopsittaci]|uniref:Uncharacterized protein n=1 Tax=Psittacicella melopsittaci TaxID=2028576 RepID=A0A3A1Y9L6_9GAMM|nr:hypothetical protein [Psittacicella melopsittaci]RIY32807.1 hypothetical protein CJP74_03670 [Psittacicella melopsittaci]
MTDKEKEVKYMEADYIEKVAPDFQSAMQAMLAYIQERKLVAATDLAPAEELTSEPNGVTSKKTQLEFKEGMDLEEFLEAQQNIVAQEMMDYMVNSAPNVLDKDEK